MCLYVVCDPVTEGDGFVVEELRSFFDQHYQHVYHVFYDIFSQVEQERRLKGQCVPSNVFGHILEC